MDGRPFLHVAESSINGRGVYARRAFAAGETVLVLDDRRVVDAERPLRVELGEFAHHCDFLAGGLVVLMPEPERYINSSCEPNTFVTTRDDGRHVVALVDIPAGAEITYDYLINLHDGVQWLCRCGASTCRGAQPTTFFALPLHLQRRYRPLLDRWFVEAHADRVASLDASARTVDRNSP